MTHSQSWPARRGASPGVCRGTAPLSKVDSLNPPGTSIAGHLKSLSVSILCQHHELLDGTMGQTDLNVDAANLLKMLPT